MLKELVKYLEGAGIEKEDLQILEDEEMTVVSFTQVTEEEKVLLVSVILHQDSEQSEIYVVEKTESKAPLEVLEKLNLLNIKYNGITFFFDEQAVALKILMESDYEIRDVIEKIIVAVSVAVEEFVDL